MIIYVWNQHPMYGPYAKCCRKKYFSSMHKLTAEIMICIPGLELFV